jgi:nitroreductase
MDTEPILDIIRRRRTIRKYTEQDVSDDQIHTLLTAGMSAPSMFNRRPWHFVVIRDPATRATIADSLRLNRNLTGAPVLIGVLADVGRSPTWRLDLSGAVQNILLAATGLGLGTAWINAIDVTLSDEASHALYETLSIPEHFQLFAFINVGYPAEERPAHEATPYFASTRIRYDTWDKRVIDR